MRTRKSTGDRSREVAATTATPNTYLIHNQLPVGLSMYKSNQSDGSELGSACMNIQAYSSAEIPAEDGLTLNFLFAGSGSYVAQFCNLQPVQGQLVLEVKPTCLVLPNSIGEPPIPDPIAPVSRPNRPGQPPTDNSVVIPQNSSPILVGVARDETGKIITQEHYWALCTDSYSLGPGERIEQSYISTTGMSQTSSSFQTVSAEASTSASAGWGPVSASVSASLSTTMGRQQQITFDTQTTTSVLQIIDNLGKETGVVVYRWQLMERITWWSEEAFNIPCPPQAMLATITSGQRPEIPIGVRTSGEVVNLGTGRILRAAAKD